MGDDKAAHKGGYISITENPSPKRKFMEGSDIAAQVGSVLSMGGGLELVKYSERSVAVFGDTKRVKDQLKAAGGKYNAALKRGSSSNPGWIFPLSQQSALANLIKTRFAVSDDAGTISGKKRKERELARNSSEDECSTDEFSD